MNQTYEKADLPIPSYISTLPSPIRRRHMDNLLVSKSQARPEKAARALSDDTKNEFGFALRWVSSTTPGRRILLLSTSSLARTLSWVRKTWHSTWKYIQSWRGASGWALWTLQPPLEDSLASALASASSPSSRSSTGLELESSEPYLARSKTVKMIGLFKPLLHQTCTNLNVEIQ